MLNEFNRRNFLKLSAMGVIAALSAEHLGITTYASSDTSDQERVLEEFFATFSNGDHISWSNYFANTSYYRGFANDKNNQLQRLGLLDIDEAELLYYEKVSNIYAPKYPEYKNIFDYGDYACYRTISRMETVNEKYFGSGTNFNLVLLVKEGGKWCIGGICGCPEELCSVPTNLKISRIGYGMINYESQPSTITVKDNAGKIWNASMTTFLKNVTYNEIGNMGYTSEAIKANIMAIKMCGWWAHAANYRASEGCDLKYGDVAFATTYRETSEINSAISAVINNAVLSSGRKLFYTAYIAGSSDGSGAGSGQLRQNGSNYLARQGKNWRDIMHYYYDNSSYNSPNVGIVRIE